MTDGAGVFSLSHGLPGIACIKKKVIQATTSTVSKAMNTLFAMYFGILSLPVVGFILKGTRIVIRSIVPQNQVSVKGKQMIFLAKNDGCARVSCKTADRPEGRPAGK